MATHCCIAPSGTRSHEPRGYIQGPGFRSDPTTQLFKPQTKPMPNDMDMRSDRLKGSCIEHTLTENGSPSAMAYQPITTNPTGLAILQSFLHLTMHVHDPSSSPPPQCPGPVTSHTSEWGAATSPLATGFYARSEPQHTQQHCCLVIYCCQIS